MKFSKIVLNVIISLIILSFSGSCVYYNTFYNAKKSFNRAEKARLKSRSKSIGIGGGDYKKAIEKSLKVIENYPNSKYYDDALYVLGISYYYTKQFHKSERRLRELLANYPESEYIDQVKLYIAKTKLMQNDMENAILLFEDIFKMDFDKVFKAEAAMAIGEYHYENKNYSDAENYFIEVRDSLGSDKDALKAQNYIADGYFKTFKFKNALGAYLQILGMDPELDDKYHALYQAAECSYRLQHIVYGMDYLNTLIEDELYFDSLEVLQLKLAEGYIFDEDIELAEESYLEVAKNDNNRKATGIANYNLGLIYQFDYDDLKKAKEYYDIAVTFTRGSDIGKDALQKSSDIGKLETYARKLKIDSTTTQQDIDDAAHIQYLLGELYWFKLDKPDTAILEMQYMIDSFPTGYETPKGIIALSRMYLEYYADTAAVDSLLKKIVIDYPKSDYLPEVYELLNLTGTAADTGYAYIYINKAEEFIDLKQPDSARYYYDYVVINFPDSKFYLQALFAQIWVMEMLDSPGDSSVIFAYNEFIDSFPNSSWAGEARRRTSYSPPKKVKEQTEDPSNQEDDQWKDAFSLEQKDTTSYIDPTFSYYQGPDGDSIINMHRDVRPSEYREEFEFPLEAYRVEWIQYEYYFQVVLDFVGKVEGYKLMNPTKIEELDNRVSLYISGIIFDVSAMPTEQQGLWQVYKHVVRKPRNLGR